MSVGTSLVGACADKKGALMLAINTDMKAPKDVNAVSVTVSTNGAIKHSFIGRVTPQGDVLLPATLAIVEPDDKSASIRIRVMAFQNQKPRVLRDVRTTVPSGGRTALLRIPLNFVNDGMLAGPNLPNGLVPDAKPGTETVTSGGSAEAGTTSGGSASGGTPPGGMTGATASDYDFFGSFQPPCPDIDKQTIIDGECKDNYIDSSTLPDFDAASVGDSTNSGSCFDIVKCLGGASQLGETKDPTRDPAPPAEVDSGSSTGTSGGGGGAPDAGNFKDFVPRAVTFNRASCQIALNGSDPSKLNLAIVTPETGECVRPGECYIPLDRGDGGWKEEKGRVQLPSFVCKLLGTKNLRLVSSDGTCPAKEALNPICTPKAGDAPIEDAGISGARRLLIADFPTVVGGARAGKAHFVGKNGLFLTPPLRGDGTVVSGGDKLAPGDGSEAPRSFAFSSPTDDSSFVMTEGNHAYFVRAGGAPQRIDLNAQIVALGTDGKDHLLVTATRNGPAVFRVPAMSEGALVAQTAFTNTTGKLPTAIVAQADQVTGQPTGFLLGFEDGSIGTCEGTQACSALVRPQSFPELGRFDYLFGLPPSNSVLAKHTKGIARLDRSDQLFMSPVSIITADLSGITNAAGYFPRGFSGDIQCEYFVDAKNQVRFKNTKTNVEGTLYSSATTTIIDVTSLTLVGPSGGDFILWAVYAAGSDQGGIWGIPAPEACKGEKEKLDAGSPPDGGACPNETPIDASKLPYKSPLISYGSCSQADLDGLISYLTANPNAQYATFKVAGMPNVGCRTCVFGLETNATWSPFVEATPTTFIENRGGCIELATGKPSCGQKYQQFAECLGSACSSCTPAARQTCQNQAGTGVCRTGGDAMIAACGGLTPLQNAETMCNGPSGYPFEVPVKVQCINGFP